MRRLLALLLLAGCSSEEPAEGGNEPDAVPAALPDPGNAEAQDPAIFQARVDAAMGAVLQDAGNAQYRNLRAGLAETICGEVNPARKGGGHAGFRPFLVTPDGVAVVARGPNLTFDDPTDSFPDLYIRWCASEDELKRLGPQLDRAIARAAGPDDLPVNAEDIPAPKLEAPPPPSGPPGEKMGKGDSFFDEVRKPREPAAKGK